MLSVKILYDLHIMYMDYLPWKQKERAMLKRRQVHEFDCFVVNNQDV